MINTGKAIFLLGGIDLEMLTVKEILLRHNCTVFDNHLTWDTAKLSAYSEVLRKREPDQTVYGIELTNDLEEEIPQYVRIDHHNDYTFKESSLEQIADLLDYSLSYEEQVIAANDRGYIPAMKKLGVPDETIRDIRVRDRKAQGCTEEDEKDAEQAIAQADLSYPGLAVVASKGNRLSPVVDRLSEQYPYHSYLVLGKNEVCTYGNIAPSFRDCFRDHPALYYGGTGNGYAGLSSIGDLTPDEIICTVKQLKPISKHIFLFPFKYEGRLEDIDLDENWARITTRQQRERDKEIIFNEQQYFYPFVQNALYDMGDNSRLRHFERRFNEGQYIITTTGKAYKLTIESIKVHLYDFGLGILAFHLLNTDTHQSSPDDILIINQFGRRIMPPFYNEIAHNHPRAELADGLSILLDGTAVQENFMDFGTDDAWKAGAVITQLLKPLTPTPVLDDRMFTLCYYENNHELARLAKAGLNSSWFFRSTYNAGETCSDFWYKFLFVDGGEDATCFGNDLYTKLLRKQTYSRWEHPVWGSEYGVSRYSLVLLTSETAPYFLLDYFESIYTRLAELVLCQRAGLVMFSERVRSLSSKGINTENLEESNQLSNQYLQFVNDFCYREITAQDQGVELYTLLKSTLNLDQYEAVLREQIIQLHAQIQTVRDEESRQHNEVQDNNSYMLNRLAGAVVPVSVLAALVGIWQLWDEKLGWCIVLIIWLSVALLGLIGGILLYRRTKKGK